MSNIYIYWNSGFGYTSSYKNCKSMKSVMEYIKQQDQSKVFYIHKKGPNGYYKFAEVWRGVLKKNE